jgi:hypothetical protein
MARHLVRRYKQIFWFDWWTFIISSIVLYVIARKLFQVKPHWHPFQLIIVYLRQQIIRQTMYASKYI